MKKFITIVLLALFSICGYAQTIDPVLLQEMEQRSDDEKIQVVVIMKSQYDRQQLCRSASHYTMRAERREFVVNELKRFAEASQNDLKASLNEMERHGMTTAPTTLWMTNAITFSATKQAINDLAMRRDVLLIGYDETRHALFDQESTPTRSTQSISNNVTRVNADDVWALGYTGQGVVVALLDSGVNYNHVDLANHLWDGGTEYPHHGYDFINNDNDPMDDNGQGTQCAGTICGDGTAGTQTGIAPGATLMCVKTIDADGYGSVSVTCNAMQWAVEQGCDVINISYGWYNSSITERSLLRNTCAAVLDAGVIGAIAVGDGGYNLSYYLIPNNVTAPGSCPPPYMDSIQAANAGGLSCALAVGASSYYDGTYYYTSRGPVTWSNTSYADYPYTENSTTEFGLIRPDICAPGESVTTTYYSDNTEYVTTSGTAAAAPCVSGCISLLLSKNNNLTPAEICQLLEKNAHKIETGTTKSNITGFGRVDALAAINAIPNGPLSLEAVVINDATGNNDDKLNAGESVNLNLSLKNDSQAALNGVSLVLTSDSDLVTITNGTATLPSFSPNQTIIINNIFGFTLSEDAPPTQPIWFSAEAFLNGESLGIIRFNVMVYGHILTFNSVTITNDGNGDGSLEPGETANLHVIISNAGNEAASYVMGNLSSTFPYLIINSNNKSFGNIAVGGLASADFNVSLAGLSPDSYTIDLSLDLVDGYNEHTQVDFELWRRAITLTSDPVGAGTLTGGGNYGAGQSCTITATPNSNYVFSKWTLDGATVSYYPSYTFTVTEGAEYVAHFQQIDGIAIGNPTSNTYYIPTNTNNYYSLSQQIYTAAEMGGQPRQISSVSFFNTQYTSTRNLSIYMVHTNKTSFESRTDWISVTDANKVFSGDVTITNYDWVTIYFDTPFPYDGSSNVALVVDDNSGRSNSMARMRTFSTATSNQALYIYSNNTNYSPNTTSYNGNLLSVKNQVVFGNTHYDYTVTATAYPTSGGTVSGNTGSHYYGRRVTLTATATTGYVFNNWTKNGEVVSYYPTYSFAVTESAQYVANFQQMNGISIGIPTTSSSYYPTYYYYSLTQQIYTSSEMGNTARDIASVSFFNTGTARTRNNMDIYLVSTNKSSFYNTSDWVTVSENDKVFSGSVEFLANGWTTIYFNKLFHYNGSSNVVLVVDDNSNSYNSSTKFRSFNTTGNQSIRIYSSSPNYDPSNPSGYTGTLESLKNQVVFGYPSGNYTVTVTANPTAGGTVSGGEGTYFQGQSCTVTATANEGYCFNNWTINGTVVSSSATYTFPVMGNTTIVANFGDPIMITATANPTAGGSVSGAGGYGNGQSCTLTATPEPGYVFSNWTKNGSVVSSYPSYTFTVTAAGEYVANFRQIGNGIAIGEPGSSNYYLPSYVYYYYSLTQQIYTTAELGGARPISSVSFYNTSSSSPTREVSVYLVYTNKTSFDNTTDWISVTENNLVYSGTFKASSRNWSTIYFNTPFQYNGMSNLALIVYDKTNERYYSELSCRTFETEGNQAIRVHSESPIDPHGPTNTGTLVARKNQIILDYPVYEYTMTLSANPEEGGTVSGGGAGNFYYYGQPVVATATANSGYVFNYWTKYVNTNYGYGYDQIVSYLSPANLPVTADGIEYKAQFQEMDGIVIGDAHGTNRNLPTYVDYPYSLSQQIYTAEELNIDAGEISSVSFFNAGSNDNRDLTIYMVNTTKSGFSGISDWISVTDDDIVFDGISYIEDGNWTTIYFNSPFSYDGTSNVALVVYDKTGESGWGGMKCRTFSTTTNQAICATDNYVINPNSPVAVSTLMSEKNQVVFTVANYIYPVTVSADPEEGGVVSGGGGLHYHGQPITISATPNQGYVFNNWTRYYEEYGYEYDEIVSAFSTANVSVMDTSDYVAHFQQMDGIIIGEAAKINLNLPVHYYYYSLTQQIYTADEINHGACDLSSVSFYNTENTLTRNLDIYLVNTSKSAFDGDSDWIAVTEADLVFSGNVSINGYEWTTIYFSRGFSYDGTSNVALIINDKTGNWGYESYCRTFDADGNQAIYVYRSESSFDPTNPSEYTGELLTEKNQVVFGVASYDFQVTTSANPTEGGTTSLIGNGHNGYYYYGQPISIAATANQGYAFSKWTKGDEVLSCYPEDNVSVTETAEYVANFKQVDGILIGGPSHANSNLPTNSYNTLTEEIFTAAEMGGQSCQISSVSFFNTGNTRTRNYVDIYMVYTQKSAFESTTDWISVTENDTILYSGKVVFTAKDWVTIYFSKPFYYNGSSNVALIMYDHSNSYNYSDIRCRTFDTENPQVLRVSGSSTNNPFNPTGTGGLLSVKNQVIFGHAHYDYNVAATTNPTNSGTISGGIGMHYYGQPVTITAEPVSGYVFSNWTKNGEVVSHYPTYSFTVTEDIELVANFKEVDGIAVGEPVSTNYYLPTYYYYSLTQQIYTVNEMGSGNHDISSVSFYNTGTSNITRNNMSIYMVYTDKTTFESTTDWVTVTENDKVFSGKVIFTAKGWTTINFNKLFNYDGSSNVVLVVDDNSSSYNSSISCRTFSTSGSQTIRISSSNTNYDPSNPTSYTGTLMSEKNQVIFGHPSYNYSVTVTANPTEGGTVSEGGSNLFLGQSFTVSATANEGYCFNNWTLDGVVVSSDETYTFAVTGNMNLVANFGTPIMVNASASPAEGGTVSGAGGFGYNHSCTLTAVANPGYVFTKWTYMKNNYTNTASYLSTYTFQVTESLEYVANFQQVNNGVAIGDATKTNSYLPNYSYYPYSMTQQIYTANEMGNTPHEISSVSFFNTSYNRTRNLTVYMVHTNKTAFADNTDWIQVTANDIVFSGSVTLSGYNWATIYFSTPFSYNGSSNVALIVDDNTGGGYGSSASMRTFDTDGNQAIYIYNYSTDYDPCSPISSQGTLLTVKNQVIFGFVSSDYTVTISANPTDGGTVSGAEGYYYLGQPCTVTATPNGSNIFYYWKNTATGVRYFDATYTFQVMGNTDLVAYFGPPIQITASANPEEGGTITGAGEYASYQTCTLTATPEPGYVFLKWTLNGSAVSYLSTYSFTVANNANYVAVFELADPDIVIGNADATNYYLPSYTSYKYSLTEQIYTAEEIGTSGEIFKLSFFNTSYARTRDITIYMKHTDKSEFNGNYDWIPVSETDQVFNGTITFERYAWTEITLDAPFHYNGTSNVVLVVDDNTGNTSSSMNCRVFNTESSQAIYVYSSSTNYDPYNPSDYYGYRLYTKNQIRLSSSYMVTATADPTEGGTVTGGGVCPKGSTCTLTATPNQGYYFFYWTENEETVSFDASYSFTVESDRNLVAHFGQVTNHWTIDNSNFENNMALVAVIQIDGVEQRSDLLEIGAFCGTECRGTQLAEYYDIFDRYLIWIQIYGEIGEELTFKLYDHRIGQELDLSSPSMVYGDDHINPLDPYVLNFITTFDISTSVDPEGTGNVTGAGEYSYGTTCTLTATPNSGYQFKNWTLDGVVVSTAASYEFTVTEDATYVAHFHCVQTYSLNSGWNWFSSSLEISLDDLKAALIAALPNTNSITIKSKNNGFTVWNGNKWTGSLNTMDLAQMYMIQISTACTVELQGLPANPANHPIPINNGWNWIGYPCSQNMNISDALSDFSPESGDVIKSKNDGFTTYIVNGSISRWIGTLNTLRVGQGFMYQSFSNTPKELVYQMSRSEILLDNITSENNIYVPSEENFSTNMTITAIVELDGKELRSENYELAAFVGDECRGSVKLLYVEPFDRYIAFLTVYGETTEEMYFVLTDGWNSGKSDDHMEYVVDGTVGITTDPVVLHFGTLNVDDIGQVVVNVFPNPSNGIFNVEGNCIRKIEVMDALGQIILSKEVEDDYLQINLNNRATGVYLLRVITDDGISTHQIIKE